MIKDQIWQRPNLSKTRSGVTPFIWVLPAFGFYSRAANRNFFRPKSAELINAAIFGISELNWICCYVAGELLQKKLEMLDAKIFHKKKLKSILRSISIYIYDANVTYDLLDLCNNGQARVRVVVAPWLFDQGWRWLRWPCHSVALSPTMSCRPASTSTDEPSLGLNAMAATATAAMLHAMAAVSTMNKGS